MDVMVWPFRERERSGEHRPTPPGTLHYQLKPPPDEWDDDMRRRFGERFSEVKEEMAQKYEGLVRAGRIEAEEALEACFHEVLSRLAREFGLTLITTRW